MILSKVKLHFSDFKGLLSQDEGWADFVKIFRAIPFYEGI
jgi:hypothetical protein